ncbi:MAG: NADH dehydrogenase (quinone) subunit D [Nitrospinota bacterium]
MVLNMGPQHPSTHGVLRLVLELEGETVVACKPVIGYLHTGIEKSMEAKTYNKALTLTDRMDYLAPLSNNLGFVLAVERLLSLEVPRKAQYVRVLLTELTRIASHLVWLGTHALDIGAITVFLYCFREREQLMKIFERASGVRMMTSHFRVGGLARPPYPELGRDVRAFLGEFPQRVEDYETLLTENPIWMRRTQGVGVLAREDALAFGVTGPILRASGVDWDLRKRQPYSSYQEFDFRVPVRGGGDTYDRYLCRIEEMRQSARIAQQALDGMPEGPWVADAPKVVPPPKERLAFDMEALIHHFLLFTEGYQVPAGEVYLPVESPRGELGYYIVSDGGTKPYKVRVRAPSFANLQVLPKMVVGGLVADLVAVIGSVDIVLGEIDR